MIKLTEKQKQALRGELSETDYDHEGMGLFKLGLVTFDPLSKRAKSFKLTDAGREIALSLRKTKIN